ncbi:MAG: hypothetical protein WBG76_06160 [Ornithinimicrobium sp.]
MSAEHWGDGYERLEVVEHGDGFKVWYADGHDVVVGVLTYGADEDYERGGHLVAQSATLAEALRGEQGSRRGSSNCQERYALRAADFGVPSTPARP